MHHTLCRIAAMLAVLCSTLIGQEPDQPTTAVPRLITLNGVFHPAIGLPGTNENATFSVYKEQQGGLPASAYLLSGAASASSGVANATNPSAKTQAKLSNPKQPAPDLANGNAN